MIRAIRHTLTYFSQDNEKTGKFFVHKFTKQTL